MTVYENYLSIIIIIITILPKFGEIIYLRLLIYLAYENMIVGYDYINIP